ncbi:hypothetical protein T265_14038, partial [Opisthorchis viverrini]
MCYHLLLPEEHSVDNLYGPTVVAVIHISVELEGETSSKVAWTNVYVFWAKKPSSEADYELCDRTSIVDTDHAICRKTAFTAVHQIRVGLPRINIWMLRIGQNVLVVSISVDLKAHINAKPLNQLALIRLSFPQSDHSIHSIRLRLRLIA